MRQWITQIKAIKPSTGEITTYTGPNVPGINYQDANSYCQTNGLGYCQVIGVLIAEIPVKDNKADFENITHYENLN